ncbi:hypothetical protein D7X33_17765 [Butyricicoccus sp. 1XD8-22]|nr:hypothetical protein D7X33_17765 [Butyricicoccus sp. 1XD8-22]
MSLNSFFSDLQPNQQNVKKEPEKKPKTPRKTRSDKRHNIKFPINTEEHQLLKMYFKQASESYKRKYQNELTQTMFNTYLLNFALTHLHIVNWTKPYKDTKRYMHTQPLETEYREIGGPYGLSTQKQLSDRKVVYYLVISSLNWLRREGDYDKIL